MHLIDRTVHAAYRVNVLHRWREWIKNSWTRAAYTFEHQISSAWITFLQLPPAIAELHHWLKFEIYRADKTSNSEKTFKSFWVPVTCYECCVQLILKRPNVWSANGVSCESRTFFRSIVITLLCWTVLVAFSGPERVNMRQLKCVRTIITWLEGPGLLMFVLSNAFAQFMLK